MKKKSILLFLLLLHLLFLTNLRFTAWPEMFSYAYLRKNGFLIYKDMIHPYPPVLTIFLSIIYNFFGYQLTVLKTFTWLVILVNDILIILIVKKVIRSYKSLVVGLLFYVVLQPFLGGNLLWFDLAIVPPILLAVYYLLRESTKKNILIAGIFLGIAALIKQTAGIFIVIGILYLMFREKDRKKLFYFMAGPVVMGLTLLIRLHGENALIDFFNWTLVYPFTEWRSFPGYVQMKLNKQHLLFLFLLFLPSFFLLVKLKTKILRDPKLLLFFLFLVGSIILIYPRFSFFHFQLCLAFLAIVWGVVVNKLTSSYLVVATYFTLLFFVILFPVVKEDWHKEARFYSNQDQFYAQIISQKVAKTEKVYLLGLDSSLYVMADRIPPKRWTDNFGWYLEIPGVQEEIIFRWSLDPPKYIFWREPNLGNWFDLGVYQPRKLTNWIKDNYTKEELAWEGVWVWKKLN